MLGARSIHLRIILRLTLATAVLLAAHSPLHAKGKGTDAEIKAAILYNILFFTDWPKSVLPKNNSPITVGILGSDRVADALKKLTKKTIRKHPIRIIQIKDSTDGKKCHAVYLARSERHRNYTFTSGLGSAHTLTFSDIDNFTTDGGIVAFVEVGGKVRFSIHNKKARSVKLRINPKILAMGVDAP